MLTELRIGDLITTYHSGIWKLIKIERRFYQTEGDIPSFLKDTKKVGDEYSPLLSYEKLCDTKGNSPNKKIVKQCDSSFCKLAENYIKEQEEILDKLKNIIKNNATNN